MKIEVHNTCKDFNSYRAARVKSLFNAESGAEFTLSAELPIDDPDWKLGLVVGPSGSGKTSIGKRIFGEDCFYRPAWESSSPIVDEIATDGEFDAVTAALAGVGLGDVPAWLRPYAVLSNGEQFRADLARVLCEKPEKIVIDEFTSVVDRQIAKFGALAFQKAWRRTAGQAVLLSCHYDIIDWVEPDWVFDTATGKYSGRSLWRRPRFELEIWKTNGSYWKLFEPHHYLKLPPMIAAEYYVGTVDGELVCHLGVSPKFEIPAFRACRLVVMPEWQGAGIGMRFLNAICQMQLDGINRYQRRLPTYFHTSHPALCAALRRDRKWRQCSASLYGADKRDSNRSIYKSARKYGRTIVSSGFGGHFRAVQGFKYVGEK
jgi:GNAT superfamily N-acetyltransferase